MLEVFVDSLKINANESDKTKKARFKLKKQLEKIDKQVTQEALKRKVQEIHYWIARHAHNRVVLKSKNISLFDENQNAAELSNRVINILNVLKKDIFLPSKKSVSNFDLRKKIDVTLND